MRSLLEEQLQNENNELITISLFLNYAEQFLSPPVSTVYVSSVSGVWSLGNYLTKHVPLPQLPDKWI